MKLHQVITNQLAVLGGFALLVCATSTQAADPTQGLYVNMDTGINLMTGIRTTAGNIRMQPGVRGDLDVGYGIKLADQVTLGLEAEGGFIWNQFSSIEAGGAETEFGGNNYQVPVLGNVVLAWHAGKWTPYIGGGGGVDYVAMNARSYGNGNFVFNGSDWGPAVQGEAGVKYAICSNCEVGLGYRYLAAFSERIGGDGLGLRASQINNHTISLMFTIHF